MFKQVETVAERLQTALDLRQMKVGELAEKSGVDQGSVSSYVSGRYEPKSKKILALAKALEVSEIWLMGYDVPIEGLQPAILSAEAKEVASAYEKLPEEGRALVRRMLGLSE